MPHRTTSPVVVDTNPNTSWLSSPAAWAWYCLLVVSSWLVVAAVLNDGGLAWTYVHLAHAAITYYCFHFVKGVPWTDQPDSGRYEAKTFWEQVGRCHQPGAVREHMALEGAHSYHSLRM
jgi:hypothetical protein